jgi:hypothetical protein
LEGIYNGVETNKQHNIHNIMAERWTSKSYTLDLTPGMCDYVWPYLEKGICDFWRPSEEAQPCQLPDFWLFHCCCKY